MNGGFFQQNQKRNVTLNSASATQLINNLFSHKSRNPTIKLTLRLCAISDRGKENQVDWTYAPCGMDLWDELQSCLQCHRFCIRVMC
jgi:hypothetical protein